MTRNREQNYELLRTVCAIAVIAIHVSASYLEAIVNDRAFGQLYLNGIIWSCAYNVLSRFAVPCFVMLTGAFALADDRNEDYRYFYGKTFINVGIPTLVFSVLYFLFAMMKEILLIGVGDRDLSELIQPVLDWVTGTPYYHMWYLYMMAGVYLLVPFVLMVKKQVGERNFGKAAWIFLILASIGDLTSTEKLYWDVGYSFRYTGYLMVGYELRKLAVGHKNNRKGLFLIGGGIMVECVAMILRYRQALSGIADEDLKYKLVPPLSPLVVVASVLIFAGFSFLHIKANGSKIAGITFPIYLIHAGVWDVLAIIVRKLGYAWDNRIVIPVSIIIVFVLSALLSKIYLVIWNRVRGNGRRQRVRTKRDYNVTSNKHE
ncbi:MAG: acyltransferase family protein [Butyrivibrio sp.]|nr:acyltransferase family protein [Acetatifactor muris]MCM1558925.1 acyltransferase family protein [Butyrivibrio sp.]